MIYWHIDGGNDWESGCGCTTSILHKILSNEINCSFETLSDIHRTCSHNLDFQWDSYSKEWMEIWWDLLWFFGSIGLTISFSLIWIDDGQILCRNISMKKRNSRFGDCNWEWQCCQYFEEWNAQNCLKMKNCLN